MIVFNGSRTKAAAVMKAAVVTAPRAASHPLQPDGELVVCWVHREIPTCLRLQIKTRASAAAVDASPSQSTHLN